MFIRFQEQIATPQEIELVRWQGTRGIWRLGHEATQRVLPKKLRSTFKETTVRTYNQNFWNTPSSVYLNRLLAVRKVLPKR